LTDDNGGILDDLMVSRSADHAHDRWLFLVVNAACKEADYAHIAARLAPGVSLLPSEEFALIALQGPAAVDVLADHDPRVSQMSFMTAAVATIAGVTVHLTRSGYTGEDGFEIPVPVGAVADVWSALAADARVQPIGLGARDSLRLEAGLCLYGHDIDTTTTPVEADLAWSIQKRRREEGGFPGADRILRELKEGATRKRVGIKPEGRAPAREGAEILSPNDTPVGTITSGGFGPSVNGPVAMGYVAIEHSEPGTPVQLIVRGKMLPASVVKLPFAPHRYKR
jgi:aminomethyltransferase